MRSSQIARKPSRFRSGPYLHEMFERAGRMDERLQAEICARIKQARIESGMTLEELADTLGVTPRAYWNYENNRVPFRRLKEIAEVTGARFDWLLRGDAVEAIPASTALLQGVAQGVEALEESAEDVRQRLLEVVERLTLIEAALSPGSKTPASQRKGSRPV